MSISIVDDPTPLRVDPHGVLRIGKTRIPLERVIFFYRQGETPEQIVDSFDTLELADVYTLIGYYLRHRAEVDAYVEERERQNEEAIREIEARFPHDGLRERLLARRNSQTPTEG